MSKFLSRHSEGWQCARDTAFNRLVSDVQASKFKAKRVKNANGELNEETLSEERYKQYENIIIRDELTGLYNSNFFSEKLIKELKRSKRYKRPFSLMLISIDKLAQLQKLYGNQFLCQILQEEAKTISASIREVDMAFRIGSTQFAIICPETYSSKATIVGQRICDKTKTNSITNGANTIIVTASIGIAAFPSHGRQEKELITMVMQFLKEAQNNGGNLVQTN